MTEFGFPTTTGSFLAGILIAPTTAPVPKKIFQLAMISVEV